MKRFKGIIHVHSNYSHDGQHSLEEIVQFGTRCGYNFIGMSEHSDTLNEEKMTEYVKECQKVSSSHCLIIPGIEFTCENNLHIVGLGVQHYTEAKNPFKVTEFIQKQGGLAIIAHPTRYNYKIRADLAIMVDGIEIWNSVYDGRFVPNDKSLNLVKEIKNNNKTILAFGGQDLHRINGNCKVETTLSCDKLNNFAILQALKEGKFTISNHYFWLDSKCDISSLKI